MNSVFLCDVSHLRSHGSFVKYIEILRDEVIAYIFDDDVIVRSTFCPHFGGHISVDELNERLRCNWHGWEFCPKSGKCISHNIGAILSSYDVEINGDSIFVLVP